MRRVCVANPNEHGPTGYEPYMTDKGYRLHGGDDSEPAKATDGDLEEPDDEVYEIDRIVSADRIGNRYRIWVKWKGYDEITSRWRHELIAECSNRELLDEMEVAVQRARDRHRAEHGHLDEDPEPESVAPDITQPAQALPVGGADALDDDRPLAQRRPRRKGSAKQNVMLCEALPAVFTERIKEALSARAYRSLRAWRSVCDHPQLYCLAAV